MKDIVKQFKKPVSKLTPTETLEKAIEENYWNTITICENSNNTNMKYVEELINTSFINGVKFIQKWTYIEEELPDYYQIALADNGEYTAVVARVSDGNEDLYPICGTNVYMSPNPIKWRPIEN